MTPSVGDGMRRQSRQIDTDVRMEGREPLESGVSRGGDSTEHALCQSSGREALWREWRKGRIGTAEHPFSEVGQEYKDGDRSESRTWSQSPTPT